MTARVAGSIWGGGLWLALTAGAASAPNVLVVTVDTLRPDALGWVAGTGATPHIDRLAAEGLAFPAAVAPAPLTLPAHVSLFTGLGPPRHGVRDNGQVLSAGPPLLAEVLADAGYATAAFVSGYPLARPFGLARGFEHYDDRLSEGEGQWLERRAPATVAAALAWLSAAPEPWHVWIHFYDPHLPYEPPAELAGDGPRGAYDGEVAAVDRAIGILRARLPASGREVVTLFAGDHGESLGEHGEASHGFFVYDSTLRVPVVFHAPGRVEPGRSAAPIRLVDLTPTLLALLGLPVPRDLDGVSLAPTLAGEAQAVEPAYFETYQPWRSYGWAPLRGVLAGGWKWIAAPRPELYDLSVDPAESTNLYAERPQQGRAMHRLLREILEREAPAGAAVEDPEALARLRALGYLGTGAARVGEPPHGLPDPKDRLALREVLTEGQALLDGGDPRGALARFDAALREEPDNRFALSRSGLALLELGDVPAALSRLQRAVALDAEQPATRAVLAEALGRAGRFADAAAEWMEVVRRQPTVARHWSNLGATLGRAGETGRAVEALARAVELEPGDPERLARLAFAEFAAGDLAAAAGHLQAAATASGDAFPHAGALGLVLARLGRAEEARPWLARARPTEPEFAEARLELARLELARGDREAARKALDEALAAAPQLRPRVLADPALAALVDG